MTNSANRPGWRLPCAIGWGVALAIVFGPTLIRLAIYVSKADLHSHILLVPFVSAYLVYLNREKQPPAYSSAPFWGAGSLVLGLAALWTDLQSPREGTPALSQNDHFALMAFAFVAIFAAGGFFFLGRRWMASMAFPMAFLLFMIPLPDLAVQWLETGSKLASAEAAAFLFHMAGTPFLRDGTVFQLPAITLQVAQECSGIRSSWVLLITSLLAAHLFLHDSWRRLTLVAFVIPLGILRNGFRIMVIGELCTEFGPRMIDSPIHHRGGPIFFALSLIPLFVLAWWLRRGDRHARGESESFSATPSAP